MAITKRGYGESMIYSKYPEYEKNILEYIMSSERIDKMSDRFAGVSEDVKRRQVTAVLHRTLMDENVVLCIHRKGMPAAFKVFLARDVKEGRQPTVFIDVTDLIVMKNGFYDCPKIDVLCTYLMAAMTMLVYEREPEKLLNSSVIVTTSTSCFVSMFTYILDYLRVNGFSENRIKISYIVAMYYQYHLLGKDRDRTAMNIAVKVSKAAIKDINAYEFYYNTEDLDNIGTLIKMLSDTFKLQGLTVDVFLEKWLWLIGKGTQFGTEIYTAFSKILTDAYSGTYINNQKSIEKCCGRDMVEYVNSLLRICSDIIDRGMHYESVDDRKNIDDYLNRKRHPVMEALFTDKKVKDARKQLDASLGPNGSQSAQIAAVKNLVKVLDETGADQKKKNNYLRMAYFGINADSDNYILGKKSGYKPVLTPVCKTIKGHISPQLRDQIVQNLEKVCNYMPGQLAAKNPTFMQHEKESRAVLKDAQDALKVMKSGAQKESAEDVVYEYATTSSVDVSNAAKGFKAACKSGNYQSMSAAFNSYIDILKRADGIKPQNKGNMIINTIRMNGPVYSDGSIMTKICRAALKSGIMPDKSISTLKKHVKQKLDYCQKIMDSFEKRNTKEKDPESYKYMSLALKDWEKAIELFK